MNTNQSLGSITDDSVDTVWDDLKKKEIKPDTACVDAIKNDEDGIAPMSEVCEPKNKPSVFEE